ncbi:hypothetical protein [Bacillus sp. NTK074B]
MINTSILSNMKKGRLPITDLPYSMGFIIFVWMSTVYRALTSASP